MNSPESGGLEKTAGNSDFLVKLMNTLFNPLARQEIFSPPNSTPLSRAFHHAGGLAIGYGGLGMVLRKVIHSYQGADTGSDENKTMRALRAFSAARNPTLSIDPYLNDDKQEKELENLGIPELPVLKEAGSLPGPVERELKGNHDPAHLALALSAAAASTYGGWKLSDYFADREREKTLDTRISKMKNLIDKMVFEEVQRSRGPQKEAAFAAACLCLEKTGLSSQYEPEKGRGSLWGAGTTAVANAHQGLSTMWWLWVAAAFAVSYAASKRYSDKADPNRKRFKDLENISKERAKVHESPVLLDESSLSSIPTLSGRPKSPPSRSVAAVPVQGVKPKTPVDDTDPYASILQ